MHVRWVAILIASLLPGCVIVQVGVTNPIPGLTRVAVAPFFNLSTEPQSVADGRRAALAYYSELQKTPGFQVIPIGVVEEAIENYRLELNHPDDALRLCELVGCDAVVIGAITDYDPYYPPRLGLQVSWYSPHAWEFTPGLPIDPHARSAIRKSDAEARKAEIRGWTAERRAKFRARLNRGDCPEGPCAPCEACPPAAAPTAVTALPVVRGQSEGAPRVRANGEVPLVAGERSPENATNSRPWWEADLRYFGGWAMSSAEQSSESLEEEPRVGSRADPTEVDATRNDAAEAVSRQSDESLSLRTRSPYARPATDFSPAATNVNRETARSSSSDRFPERPATGAITPAVRLTEAPETDRRVQPVADGSPTSTRAMAPGRIAQQLDVPVPPLPNLEAAPAPALIPQTQTPSAPATQPFASPVPTSIPAPGPGTAGPVRSAEEFDPRRPLMSYTRMFDGTDAALVATLRDYLELSGDRRSGSWEATLHRSDDFFRFCARQMVIEMLTLHGGEAQKRLVLKCRRYR